MHALIQLSKLLIVVLVLLVGFAFLMEPSVPQFQWIITDTPEGEIHARYEGGIWKETITYSHGDERMTYHAWVDPDGITHRVFLDTSDAMLEPSPLMVRVP